MLKPKWDDPLPSVSYILTHERARCAHINLVNGGEKIHCFAFCHAQALKKAVWRQRRYKSRCILLFTTALVITKE
jgi:hypothetical protein